MREATENEVELFSKHYAIWKKENEAKEQPDFKPFDKVLADIEKRDWDDSHRAVAPLRQAEDAVLLDTTALDFDQSREALLNIIRGRTNL